MLGDALSVHVWRPVDHREAVRDQVGALGLHDVRKRAEPDLDDLLPAGVCQGQEDAALDCSW